MTNRYDYYKERDRSNTLTWEDFGNRGLMFGFCLVKKICEFPLRFIMVLYWLFPVFYMILP